jgi:hypothetical protein
MYMSAFCISLDPQPPLLNHDYVHPHYTERVHINLDIKKDINPHWEKLLNGNGLILTRVELFYGPPDLEYTMIIHVDSGPGDRGKVNWVFGGSGSKMHWYRNINSVPKDVLITSVGSKYNQYDPADVELIHTNTIANPSLVQVGVPHNITNPGQERWCYSMVITDSLTNDNATFGRLKKFFGK